MSIFKIFCLALSLGCTALVHAQELAPAESFDFPEEIAMASPLKKAEEPANIPAPHENVQTENTPEKASPETPADAGYTINYNTVSIVEYIRFASKICNTNFMFNESDLDFTITVVSDEPITQQNVMATLLQTLRIHGLELLEQDNSLVIHKAVDVRQIPTVVTDKDPAKNAPIVTRIFRITYVKPDTIAGIIRPMISTAALLEVSAETRQLILSDITANVEKVAELIEILDSPHNPLEMRTYQPLHNSPEALVDLASQIMSPLTQGHPFTIVAQPLANSIFIVSTPEIADQAVAALKNLDVPAKAEIVSQRKLKGENIFVYKAMNRSSDDILNNLNEIAKNLQNTGIPEGDLIQTISTARSVKETNSILFVGSKDSIAKVKEFLTSIDVAGKEAPSVRNSFFVYKPQNRSAPEIEQALREMAANLKDSKGVDPALLDMLMSAKINLATNTIVFSGEESQFNQIKSLLANIDTPSGKPLTLKNNFFLYKIQHASFQELQASLNDFAKNLSKSSVNDEGLVQTIHDMKYISETNSILFSGPDPALKQLRDLAPVFDSGISSLPVSNQFFTYKTRYIRTDQFINSIKEMTANLKADSLADPAFIRTLESMKPVKATNSILFTGDSASLKRLDDLIKTIDIPTTPTAEKAFFLYAPQYAAKDKTENYLNQLANNLDRKNEAALIETIRSMKWIDTSNSFMFQGNDNTIARLKDILKAFDTPGTQTAKSEYFMYKLKEAPGDLVEEHLAQLAKTFKAAGVKDQNLFNVIDNIRYVKETNSLLLTGDPTAVEEVKKLIGQYDPITGNKNTNSDFFMYKPVHRPAAEIEKSLQDVATNLKKANLADASLLTTISTAKYVPTTNSLIFTGSSDSIKKIQSLIKDIDVPSQAQAGIQHVGKTTFLLYKLKYAGGPQIIDSLKTMENNLKKSGGADKLFLSTLDSVKYVKETNSLLFTGDDATLSKVEQLLEKFDIPSLATPTPPVKPASTATSPNFFLYKPQTLSGPELEKVLDEFANHLKLSGLSDPELFNAITSMRWVDKTQSLIFTGTPKALDQVKELLKEFDIPANLPGGKVPGSETSIQTIDNTSFLVYKLQFHRGDEIQGALKQIAKDLTKNNAPINQNLLNSIQSIQWLDVTNSLLCSGDQETLSRLKELIKNLDIPLKQVFIEILIIETSLTNALNFGLEWGSNYKFNDKFGISSYNTIPQANTQSVFPDTFISNLSNLTPPAAPTPIGNIPPSSGFDLGVIGEVIKHNGQTFLTLGSLLTALQNDTETTIVNTPKILAQDGRTSTFFAGANVPFTGSFVNNTQSGATVQTSNLEYRDIGLNLTITPVLGNSDIVTLDINLDREQTATDITQTQLNFNAQTANGIVTSKTTMQTTVHVPDRNFLVLSGFVNNSNTKQKAGIPCLGGLPLIGAAFSQSNDTISNQNIVIFLRPYILNSIDDMRRMTSEQEDFFRDQANTPFLEHYYDESLELLKTIEDD